MASRIIWDEVEIGDFVVLECLKPRSRGAIRRRRLDVSDSSEPTIIVSESEASLPVRPGMPLRVQAIDLPFVWCTLLTPGGEESALAPIDVRPLVFRRPSKDYVHRIMTFSPPEVESPDEQPVEQEWDDTEEVPL